MRSDLLGPVHAHAHAHRLFSEHCSQAMCRVQRWPQTADAEKLAYAGLQVKAMHVDIETCSSLSAGQTVCDIWGRSALPKNATVALVRSLGCCHRSVVVMLRL
jgi:hypothetical protein